MLPVLHVAPGVKSRGGVESILDVHERLDAAAGVDSRFLALFDSPGAAGFHAHAHYASLDLSGADSLGRCRKRYRDGLQRHSPSVILCHSCWGTRLFGDTRPELPRIAVMHMTLDKFGPCVAGLAGWFDGILCCSASDRESIRRYLPSMPPERIGLAPIPVKAEVTAARPVQPALAGRAVVLGYNGRIEVTQKRLDRLPALIEACDRIGLNFRFELLGDGAYAPSLRKRFARDPRVVFHGSLDGADYCRVVGGWDAGVYFSDFEGGPIGLLEAMAVGAVPFYPALSGSFADRYVAALGAGSHYPPGEMGALARAVQALTRLSAAQLAALRTRSRALIVEHTEAHYHEQATRFIREVAGWPRLSQRVPANGLSGPRLALPLGVVTRFAPAALSPY